jgi:GIY-YIG catalytic domain-containing protein
MFHYVYILQTVNDRDRFYVGCTEDLRKRLSKHNNGEFPLLPNTGLGKSRPQPPLEMRNGPSLSNVIQKVPREERSPKSAFEPSPEHREEEGCRAEHRATRPSIRKPCPPCPQATLCLPATAWSRVPAARSRKSLISQSLCVSSLPGVAFPSGTPGAPG